MPQYNKLTVQRAVRAYPEPIHTRMGTTYIAERVYNKDKKYVGSIVWFYTNEVENEKPKFVKFIPKGEEYRYSSLTRNF